MGSIYRPKYKARDGTRRESAVWWVKFYRDGKPIRESTETEKYTEAKAYLQRKEGRVAAGEPVMKNEGRVLFRELLALVVDDYRLNEKKTLGKVEKQIETHHEPFFGQMRASAVTSDLVGRYKVARREAGAAKATVNRELSTIRRAFNLGMAATPPKIRFAPKIATFDETGNERQGFFEAEQFGSVVKRLPDYLQPVMRFAYLTGWRVPSEVLTLQWRQVDLEAGVIRLEHGTTKNKQGRVLPFDVLPELRAILEEQDQRREELKARGILCPWVFHRRGRRIRDYYTAWDNACEKAGVPGRIVHDFRRTAARNLIRAGVTEPVAMKITGHKTPSVFRRYNVTAEDDLREAMAKLGNYLTGKVTGKVGQKRAAVARGGRSK